jgi:hypothetical protein
MSLKLGINISEETYLEMCDLITHYKNVQLGIHEANDDGIELPYISTATVEVEHKYNPKYGAYKECECGHDYHRHFDGYEDNEAVGCKYCRCNHFKARTDVKKTK